MKHTPGPWRFQREHTVSFDGSGDVAFPIYNTSGKFAHVATAMSEANARLITAAPELLEACKAALEFTPAAWKNLKQTHDAENEYVVRLRAAIAKAEGTVKV